MKKKTDKLITILFISGYLGLMSGFVVYYALEHKSGSRTDTRLEQEKNTKEDTKKKNEELDDYYSFVKGQKLFAMNKYQR